MIRIVIILLITLFAKNFCQGQFKKQLDSLCIICNNKTTDSEKVVALGKLADLYYTYQLNRQGDSVLHQQLILADLSDNNNLILLTLFGEAVTNISPLASAESFDKTVEFIQKGIDYAKSQNRYDYVAIGYSRMANLLSKRGQNDKALTNAQLAVNEIPNIKSDSIKSIVYIELGNSYEAKAEAISAYKNYINAFDIAFTIKSVPLQSVIYHCVAEMYHSLGKDELAKEELKKSLELNKENNYGEGLIRDYYDLARITDLKPFIYKAIEMSDSLRYYKYILQAKTLMFYYYMIVDTNKNNSALVYLDSQPDVKESILNLGIANYYRTRGQVFLYSQKPDSALHYFKLAENDLVSQFGEKLSRAIFREIAESYTMLNDVPNAIAYNLKVLTVSKKMNDAKEIAPVSAKLSKLYQQQGDYQQAFNYSIQASQYKDSLLKLSEASALALLGIDREKRNHDEVLRQEQLRLNNQMDVQYMAISIVISVVFLSLLIIGMFPVSKVTIRMLGYFFFISLFEFIVLVIDNTLLSKVVHNEPLKLWMVKIVLIAALVPFQHYLEHNLIRLLESRKLLNARAKFSVRKWFYTNKKPGPEGPIPSIEEDTAVL
ncbi:MAG: hypothetical protein ABJA57_04895 [Ginsengibacter sp.]